MPAAILTILLSFAASIYAEAVPEMRLSDLGNLLDATQWSSTSRISCVGKAPLRIVWTGGDFKKHFVEGPAFDLKGATHVRGQLKFQKIRWDESCYGAATVAFYNDKGKMLWRKRFDQSNLTGYSPFKVEEFQVPSAIGESVDYFNFWEVPEGAVSMRAGWSFSYNPAEIAVEELSFSSVSPENKPWFKTPEQRADLVLPSRAISDEELDKVLAAREPALATLHRDGGRVELTINGQRELPYFMHNCPYPIKNLENYTGYFNAMGFRFATVPLNLGEGIRPHMPSALLEDGSIDIESWRQEVRAHLKQAPDSYLILSVWIFPTKGWLQKNQDQLMKDANGVDFIFGYPHYPLGKGAAKELPQGDFSRYPSLFSEKYRQHICGELQRVLREFEKTPESKAVAALYLVGGDDAQFRLPSIHSTPDLSPVAHDGFRKYLLDKYGSDAALQKAWNNPDATIAAVKLPVRPEIWPDNEQYHAWGGRSSWLSDYKACYAFSERSFKSAIRKAAKEAVPRVLVGGYDCAYGMSGSWGDTGYYQSKAYQDAGDFFIYIPSYGRDRECGDLPLGMYQFTGSLQLHNKLGIMELDVRNPEIGPLYWPPYRSANYLAKHDAGTFAIGLRRLAVQASILGSGFHYYNLQPHWCRTEKARESLTEMHRIAAQARPMPTGRNAIAMFIDENSDLYSTTHPGWIPSYFNFKNLPAYALQRSGVSFNFYLASDALHPDFEAPGVLFFADAATMSPGEIAEVRRRYGNSRRVLVWHGLPGFLASPDIEAISKAVNFQISPTSGYSSDSPVSFDARDNYQVTFRDDHGKTPLVALETNDPLMRGIQGFFMTESSIVPLVFSPHWKVNDPSAIPLAKYMDSNEIGMAVKRHQDFTEVFIGQPGAVTPQLLRNFLREAGITPAIESNDIFLCGSGLMGIGASMGSGTRSICLPDGVTRAIPLSPHSISKQNGNRIEVFIKHRDFAVFRLE